MPSQCTPTSLPLSPLFLSSFCLSLFVCISPSISVPVLVLAMYRLTDGPLFAVLSYLSGGGGDVFGVAVVLLPVAEQRPVQLQVTPWPKADAAFELEMSWQCSETLYDTWMKSSHKRILGYCRRNVPFWRLCLFFILMVLKFAEASVVVVNTCQCVIS